MIPCSAIVSGVTTVMKGCVGEGDRQKYCAFKSSKAGFVYIFKLTLQSSTHFIVGDCLEAFPPLIFLLTVLYFSSMLQESHLGRPRVSPLLSQFSQKDAWSEQWLFPWIHLRKFEKERVIKALRKLIAHGTSLNKRSSIVAIDLMGNGLLKTAYSAPR